MVNWRHLIPCAQPTASLWRDRQRRQGWYRQPELSSRKWSRDLETSSHRQGDWQWYSGTCPPQWPGLAVAGGGWLLQISRRKTACPTNHMVAYCNLGNFQYKQGNRDPNNTLFYQGVQQQKSYTYANLRLNRIKKEYQLMSVDPNFHHKNTPCQDVRQQLHVQ